MRVIRDISTPNIDEMNDWEFQQHFGVTRGQIRRRERMEEMDRRIRNNALLSRRALSAEDRRAAASLAKQFNTTVEHQLDILRQGE